MKALITGASSGIGRDMAKILASKYDELVLVGRNEERLNALKESIAKYSKVSVKLVIMDLSDYSNCVKLHNDEKDVDLLINCAGFGDNGKFSETNLEKDVMMINTNVMACHVLTKLYLKDMKAKDSGNILNVASIAGFMPGPLMATYYATKSYVVRLSEGVREELKREKSKVKISILCPGPIDTNFAKTANVNFRFDGIKSSDVAKYALDNLDKFYIVPGLGMKLARLTAQCIPGSIAAKIVYKLQTTKPRRKEK